MSTLLSGRGVDTCRSALRRVGSVSYSVIFAIDLDAVPESVRREVERVFLEIADAVETIPHASPFFTSMDDSVLQIDVEGWRPAAIVGAPVGFVGVKEAKRRLREQTHVPYLTCLGRKGGSAVTAAAVNALVADFLRGH